MLLGLDEDNPAALSQSTPAVKKGNFGESKDGTKYFKSFHHKVLKKTIISYMCPILPLLIMALYLTLTVKIPKENRDYARPKS